MKRGKTAIVLGAGASYCYDNGSNKSGIPTQENILKSMSNSIKIKVSSSTNAPNFTSTYGMVHSFPLTEYIKQLFHIKSGEDNVLDYWEILQSNGFNLESLYNHLEEYVKTNLLYDLQAIIATNVLTPTGDRKLKDVCKYHEIIAEEIEPTDYIIDFNWDTVMSDALLYKCPFWYPSTGFGLELLPLMHLKKKSYLLNSYVQLFHIHGSAFIVKQEGKENYLYIGPKSYNNFTGMKLIQDELQRPPTDEEMKKLELGWVYFKERWFHPVFIPPSKEKKEYSSVYYNRIKTNIHANLPDTKQIIIIGYSFPDADIEYLHSVFVEGVINPDTKVMIVNSTNDDKDFQNRVIKVFPNLKHKIDFGNKDFKEFIKKVK